MTQCFWAINTIKLGLIEIKILAYSLYKTFELAKYRVFNVDLDFSNFKG